MKSKPSITLKMKRAPLLICLGLVAIVVAVYCQALSFEFLPFWDDDTNIHRNPLYSPLTWQSVAMFWTGPFQQLYIPVTYTVWAALVALSRILAGTQIAVGPINPVLFHGANLAVHLLSTLMVFMILRRMLTAGSLTGSKSASQSRQPALLWASAAGALVFALHPVQVEVVAWVSGLRDLLGGALSLAAIALFLAWVEDSRKCQTRWFLYASASICLLLALGSKPGSVVTPALALLCGGSLLHSRGRPLGRLLWLLPWFLIALLEVVMTSRSQPAAELARSLVPVWARPLVALDSLGFYLGKLVWPFSLSGDYGRSPNSLFDSGTLYWSFLIPVAAALILLSLRSLRVYFLPYLLLVVGALPTLGLIPFNFQVVSTVSDRYLYLAMLGPALAVAILISRLAFRPALVLAVVLLSGWGALTVLQLPEWSNGAAFFPATLARNPTSWKSRHNYACTLDSQGKLQEALAEFQEALRLRPSNAEAHNDLALTLLKMGRRQEAIQSFQNSLQIRPTTGAARNLAAVLLINGDPAQAVRVYRLAMQIDPGDLQNQRALAWLLATHPDSKVRNGAEAVALANEIVRATGGQVPLFLLTQSAALAEAGQFDGAIMAASRASEVYRISGDPKMSEVVQAKVLPALRAHQPIRDNPATGQ